MNTSERREEILCYIKKASDAVSGAVLSKEFGVSRQIIVSDIAYLKSCGNDIIPTNRGYIFNNVKAERVVKVVHEDNEIEDELSSIVECGAQVANVFVWHKIYGKIEAPLNITSQRDVQEYMQSLKNGRSGPLKKVTSDYHYHTIEAENDDILDSVESMLKEKGYLVEEN